MIQFRSDLLLLSAQQLARALSVSTRTVWRLDSAGKIPAALRIGGQKRWRSDEIADWLAASCPPREQWEWSTESARPSTRVRLGDRTE